MPDPRFPNAKRPPIPAAIRAAIFARDFDTCVYCGSTVNLTLDHVWPFSQGGSDEASNLAVACMTDNRLAGDRVFGEFAAKRDWVRAARAALGPNALARIEAALAAGDEPAARRAMTNEDS